MTRCDRYAHPEDAEERWYYSVGPANSPLRLTNAVIP
jgi:hypothetical protein